MVKISYKVILGSDRLNKAIAKGTARLHVMSPNYKIWFNYLSNISLPIGSYMAIIAIERMAGPL